MGGGAPAESGTRDAPTATPPASGWGHLWLLYCLFSAAAQVGDGIAHALLLKRSGVGALPSVFAAKAIVALLLTLAYVPLAAALGQRRTLSAILLMIFVGSSGLYLLVASEWPWSYSMLYVFNETIQTLFKIHWGILLLATLPAAIALRRLPIIYSGARAGSVIGGLLLSLAPRIGAARLLLVASGLHLATLAFWLFGSPAPDPESPPIESDRGFFGRLASGASGALHSRLLGSIALATIALVAARHALRYLYSSTLAASFDEATLAASFGLFVAAASLVTGLLQAFATPRLLAGAGLAVANLVYALLVPIAFAAHWLAPPLVAAALARLVETELKAAVKTPISNLLYGGLPANERPAARALVLGAIVPLSTGVVSLALGLEPATTLTWGTVTGGLLVVATFAQNHSYRHAMRALDPERPHDGALSAEDALGPASDS